MNTDTEPAKLLQRRSRVFQRVLGRDPRDISLVAQPASAGIVVVKDAEHVNEAVARRRWRSGLLVATVVGVLLLRARHFRKRRRDRRTPMR